MNQKSCLRKWHPRLNWLLKGGVLFLLLSIVACRPKNQSLKNADSPSEQANKESRLLLNHATLEQSNEKGELLWKIQVDEAAYSPDRQKAQLTAVKGNIFQDGKIVLQIKSDEGAINRDGAEIFLKKNIVAVDPRNKAVIRSEEVEWRPQDAVLIVRKNLRGSHPEFEASANEGKYFPQKEHLELTGKIVGTTEAKRLQLKTEHLIWEIPNKKVIGDRLLKMVRFQGKTITDNLVANRAEVLFKTKQVIVKENIEFKSIDPPVQVASNEILWQYEARKVSSDKPSKLIQYQDGMTIAGNKTEVNFATNLAYLKGGVQGSSSTNDAKIYANDATWNMDSQTIEAVGNVIYEQLNPKFNLTGERAVGTLHNNNVVVTSNREERVVTEIFP